VTGVPPRPLPVLDGLNHMTTLICRHRSDAIRIVHHGLEGRHGIDQCHTGQKQNDHTDDWDGRGSSGAAIARLGLSAPARP
jgi:hypothetical protein